MQISELQIRIGDTSLTGKKSSRVSGDEDLPAEAGNVFVGARKNIEISNPSPHIKELLSVTYGGDIERGQPAIGSVGNCSSQAASFGSEEARSWRNSFTENEIFRQQRIAKFAIDIKAQIFAGRFAAVYPSWSYAPIIIPREVISLPLWNNFCRKEERSSFGAESLSGQFALLACSNPKCASEPRNDESREKTKKRGVPINQTQGANGLGRDDEGDSLVVVWGGLAAMLNGLLAYALLESGTKFIARYRQRKQRDHRAKNY